MLDKKNRIFLFIFMLSVCILAVSLVSVINNGQTLFFVLGSLFTGLITWLSKKFSKFLYTLQVKDSQHALLEKVIEENSEEQLVDEDEIEEPRE